MSCKEHYDFLAHYWDRIYTDVPYQETYKFIDKLRMDHHRYKDIFDVACGTGTLLSYFEKNKYETFGNDLSPEMIDKAQQKLAKTRLSCTSYFNIQTMRTFNLIVSFFNSFAYCTRLGELSSLFIKMRDMLVPNGLLIFDIFLEPKFKFKTTIILNTPKIKINRIFHGYENSEGIYISDIRYLISENNKSLKIVNHKTKRGIFTHKEIMNILERVKMEPLLVKEGLFFEDTTTFVAKNQ